MLLYVNDIQTIVMPWLWDRWLLMGIYCVIVIYPHLYSVMMLGVHVTHSFNFQNVKWMPLEMPDKSLHMTLVWTSQFEVACNPITCWCQDFTEVFETHFFFRPSQVERKVILSYGPDRDLEVMLTSVHPLFFWFCTVFWVLRNYFSKYNVIIANRTNGQSYKNKRQVLINHSFPLTL